MNKKIKCVISYDGSYFSGFQIQPSCRTVQGEIERALKKIHKGKHIRIYGSGRTDTGVHAKGQTFHFQSSLSLPEVNWKRALNTLLPNDIHVHQVEKVPLAFHARFDALEKEYRYFVEVVDEANVFTRNYRYQIYDHLQMELIDRACKHLQGKHDFTSFSSAKATAKGSRVRTLSLVQCRKCENEYEFIFRGNGFLYHMVRIMVGVLLDVGRGLLDPDDIPNLLHQKDRTLVGDTVPPQGLYLWKVYYDPEIKNI